MRKNVFLFLVAGLGGCILVLYQNATVVDFTQTQKKSQKLTTIEKAIAKSDREQSVRQKRMGVAPDQVQKKFKKKKRIPAAIGDTPFYETPQNKSLKKPASHPLE